MIKRTSALCRLLESSFVSGVVLWNNEVKLLKTESFVRFSLMRNETCVHQIQKGLIIYVVSNCSGDLLQLFESDVAFLLCVIQSENSFEAVLCLVLTNFCAYAINELIKIKGFVSFPHWDDNAFDERTSSAQVKLFENFDDFDRVNFTASVLIENQESISETFVVGRTDSFSPGCGDWFLGLLFGFIASTE